MGGLTITLPGEAVLFSIKGVITRGATTQPPSEYIKRERGDIWTDFVERHYDVLAFNLVMETCHIT